MTSCLRQQISACNREQHLHEAGVVVMVNVGTKCRSAPLRFDRPVEEIGTRKKLDDSEKG